MANHRSGVRTDMKENITSMGRLIEKILWGIAITVAAVALAMRFTPFAGEAYQVSFFAILLFIVCLVIGGIRRSKIDK